MCKRQIERTDLQTTSDPVRRQTDREACRSAPATELRYRQSRVLSPPYWTVPRSAGIGSASAERWRASRSRHLFQFCSIATRRREFSEKLIEVQALVAFAVFAFAVTTLHAGDNARHLGTESRIRGRGDCQRHAKKITKFAFQLVGVSLRLENRCACFTSSTWSSNRPLCRPRPP